MAINQSELFNEIWEEREHVSELSGKPLLPKGHYQWHWQFLHVLSKGSYPSYRLNKENIMLALPEEHAIQERFPAFIEKRDELRRKYHGERKVPYYKG
jgi:hypothetical protein